MQQYFPETAAFFRHFICTVLTHTDIMPEASDRKPEHGTGIFRGECCGAQSEDLTDALSAEADPARLYLHHGA